jgi:hypothetical protein
MNKSEGLAHLFLIIGVLVVGIGVVGFFILRGSVGDSVQTFTTESVSTGEKITIPQKILDNKFGFPSGGPSDVDIFEDFGVAWVRPHPGPFQWGLMQQSADSEIDFSTTDKYVRGYQDAEFGTQVTLWPFAEWDQKKHSDYKSCLVSERDIFVEPSFEDKGIDYLKEGIENKVFGEKDFQDDNFVADMKSMKEEMVGKIGKEGMGKEEDVIFLPRSRCNPNDWENYLSWVESLVERYDGDGASDMPGLTIPIKYWEVLNEPDLNADHLDFYNGSPSDYALLLVKTADKIRSADPEAKVLIAGAAGGSRYFLDFYRGVFRNKDAHMAFDIGNVHCISNDDYESYNVEPYLKMLDEFGIDVPIWVTEAEALMSYDINVNASQTYASTQRALELGAERIFFTHQKFTRGQDRPGLPEDKLKISDYEVQLDGSDPIDAFSRITKLD